jgi:hypothetical protein
MLLLVLIGLGEKSSNILPKLTSTHCTMLIKFIPKIYSSYSQLSIRSRFSNLAFLFCFWGLPHQTPTGASPVDPLSVSHTNRNPGSAPDSIAVIFYILFFQNPNFLVSSVSKIF